MSYPSIVAVETLVESGTAGQPELSRNRDGLEGKAEGVMGKKWREPGSTHRDRVPSTVILKLSNAVNLYYCSSWRGDSQP